MLETLAQASPIPEGFICGTFDLMVLPANGPQRSTSIVDNRYTEIKLYIPSTATGLSRNLVEISHNTLTAFHTQLMMPIYPRLETTVDVGRAHILKYFTDGLQFETPSTPVALSDLAISYNVDETIVDGQTLRRTGEILRQLANYPRSQVTSSDDGEVAFYWLHKGNKIDAYLDSDGHFTWIGKFDGRYERGGDARWQNKLPSVFLEMLNRLFQ